MLQKCSLWRVATVFFENPTTKLSVAEIARRTALAPTSVRLHIDTLQQEKLVIKIETKTGKRTFPAFVASQESDLFRHYKILHNLDSVRELTATITKTTGAKAIVLFGSYRYGEDVETSDIDVLVHAEKTELKLASFEKTLRRTIQIHFTDNPRKLSGTMQQSVINGIVLYGFLALP